MFRLLATQPPGMVHFTLIDPVALGQNVAGFMQLADFDEALVTSRAWIQPGHIDQQLVDLTEHIGNIIRKYLRGQYRTLEEYKRAGGVAEPYRVLVVMDFPANFTTESARRLVNIATNGPALWGLDNRNGGYKAAHASWFQACRPGTSKYRHRLGRSAICMGQRGSDCLHTLNICMYDDKELWLF